MSILLLENYIKTILKENKEVIKVINIFDFDMTLFKSMKAPAHWNTTKSGYWWNSEKSLNQAYYEDKLDTLWIKSTIDAAYVSMSDPTALTVLCTARSDSNEIIYVTNELLRLKGLRFDQNCLFYKPTKYSGSTAQYKTEIIKRLLNSYSYVKEVNFWEDNEKNLNAAQHFIEQNNKCNNRIIRFNPKLVRV